MASATSGAASIAASLPGPPLVRWTLALSRAAAVEAATVVGGAAGAGGSAAVTGGAVMPIVAKASST